MWFCCREDDLRRSRREARGVTLCPVGLYLSLYRGTLRMPLGVGWVEPGGLAVVGTYFIFVADLKVPPVEPFCTERGSREERGTWEGGREGGRELCGSSCVRIFQLN